MPDKPTLPRLPRLPLLAYGTLRLPLAVLELPVYVLLPSLYGQTLGMNLALVGAILFAARLIDALADPVIGAAIDASRNRTALSDWVVRALPVMLAGFAALLNPPALGTWLAVWLAFFSVLTYAGYSAVSIAYQAWGASLATAPKARTRVTTVREAFGLLGVLLASSLLSSEHTVALTASLVAAAVLAAAAVRYANRRLPSITTHGPTDAASTGWSEWPRVWSNRAFRWLMAVFTINGVATAIPATLVLFFTAEVLGADSSTSARLLGLYFLAAAIGMPIWLVLSDRIGARNSWLLGMVLSVIGFIGALTLERGDIAAFAGVCVATGLALGADLAMPPALLAGVIAGHGDQGRCEGAYFGLWNLLTKLNLALAAGIGLPALGWLRTVDLPSAPTVALPLAYAGLPCLLKLVAGGVLLCAPPHPGGAASQRPPIS